MTPTTVGEGRRYHRYYVELVRAVGQFVGQLGRYQGFEIAVSAFQRFFFVLDVFAGIAIELQVANFSRKLRNGRIAVFRLPNGHEYVDASAADLLVFDAVEDRM